MTGSSTAGTGALRLGMFPLSTVLFPHAQIPLHVFEPRYRALTADCLAGDARFGIVLIARGSEVGGGDERMTVGTRAVITHAASLADGRSPTDEAQAMEWAGQAALLVQAQHSNIKITTVADLALLEAILRHRTML